MEKLHIMENMTETYKSMAEVYKNLTEEYKNMAEENKNVTEECMGTLDVVDGISERAIETGKESVSMSQQSMANFDDITQRAIQTGKESLSMWQQCEDELRDARQAFKKHGPGTGSWLTTGWFDNGNVEEAARFQQEL